MTHEQCSISDSGVPHSHVGCCKRVSWTAIFVGAFVAVGLGFLLNLFSVAIGLSVAHTATTTDAEATLAIGGFVGILIGTIVAMFAAGYASGYLGRPYCVKRNLGALYGFTTWAVALIVTVFVASHMGNYVNTYSNFVNNPATVSVSNSPNEPVYASASTNRSGTDTTVQTNTKTLGLTTTLIFVLFFVGALSSAFGGHCGMGCRDKDKDYSNRGMRGDRDQMRSDRDTRNNRIP